MNSVKIGTYQMDTAFGLYLPEYTIPAPSPQTKFVKIIGRDGSVDLSEAIGLHYDSRSWSLDFKCFDPTVNWHTLTSSVMNAIHGKRLNFEFDDDPYYFWTGRISVSSYVSNRGTGTLRVNITSDPYKYKKLSTIVTKTASTGTEYTGGVVTFNTANAQIYDLSSAINYTQDLHGYANPWPGGGGDNKFEPFSGTHNGATFTVQDDGTVKITGNATAATWTSVNQYVDLPWNGINAGDTVVLWSDIYAVVGSYEGSTLISNKASQNGVATSYTIPSNATRLRFYEYAKSTVPTAGEVFDVIGHFYFAKANSFSSWTPYENICPITGLTGLSVYVSPTQDPDDATVYNVGWSTQAGTVYGGTVDVVTGELTVTHVMNDLGNLTWTKYASYHTFVASISDLYPIDSTDYARGLICSAYPSVNYWWSSSTKPDFSISHAGTNTIAIKDSSKDSLTVGDFKTSVSGVQLCYELATPITYQLTPQEIEALVGTNNIWTSSGDVSVTVVTPETVTNNGLPAVPTVTASADMVLRWGNYSASVQQGTSTIPQLVLETGDNHIYIIGTGNISFEWSEASL